MQLELRRECEKDLKELIEVLQGLRQDGKLLLAILFGSFAKDKIHSRSDIDLAIYLNEPETVKEIEIIDRILMSTDRNIHLLRLDDEDESPFVTQEALKGIHLIEPDRDIYYQVLDRVLHETESIRFRRGISEEQD